MPWSRAPTTRLFMVCAVELMAGHRLQVTGYRGNVGKHLRVRCCCSQRQESCRSWWRST